VQHAYVCLLFTPPVAVLALPQLVVPRSLAPLRPRRHRVAALVHGGRPPALYGKYRQPWAFDRAQPQAISCMYFCFVQV
jgi:hypothetical protein